MRGRSLRSLGATSALRRPAGSNGWRRRECGELANVVDHIEPIAHGGSDDPSKLPALCASCYSAKATGTKGEAG